MPDCCRCDSQPYSRRRNPNDSHGGWRRGNDGSVSPAVRRGTGALSGERTVGRRNGCLLRLVARWERRGGNGNLRGPSLDGRKTGPHACHNQRRWRLDSVRPASGNSPVVVGFGRKRDKRWRHRHGGRVGISFFRRRGSDCGAGCLQYGQNCPNRSSGMHAGNGGARSLRCG